ncbi:MAG: glycosyltransferase family 9 protein, partial [Tumebacillaceae bacterium]
VTDEERERAVELLQMMGYRGGPIVALHPLSGSTAISRRWPAAAFVWLGQELIEQQDANVLLVGSPDERSALIKMAERIDEETMVAAGRTSLHELAALLSLCKVFVGNDSGPMHLAAAMGVRTIGLFGPNTPVKWGPLGAGNHVLSAHLPCSPCIRVSHGQFQECPLPICMTSIRPEQALAVVEEVLSEKGVYIQ